jgi:hypothetical protein
MVLSGGGGGVAMGGQHTSLEDIGTPGHFDTTFCSCLSHVRVLLLPPAGGEGGSVGVQQSFLAFINSSLLGTQLYNSSRVCRMCRYALRC